MDLKVLDERSQRRAAIELVMVDWFNGTAQRCPRQILREHYGDLKRGDPFSPPEVCRKIHAPNNSHLRVIAYHIGHTKKDALDATKQASARASFKRWCIIAWTNLEGRTDHLHPRRRLPATPPRPHRSTRRDTSSHHVTRNV